MAAKKSNNRTTNRIDIDHTSGDPLLAVAVAVIVQAIRDARQSANPKKQAESRDWLLTEGAEWLQAFDVMIDQETLESWVAAGCPDLVRDSDRESVRGLFDPDDDDDSLLFGDDV